MKISTWKLRGGNSEQDSTMKNRAWLKTGNTLHLLHTGLQGEDMTESRISSIGCPKMFLNHLYFLFSNKSSYKKKYQNMKVLRNIHDAFNIFVHKQSLMVA